jgi:hypothetical protein
VRRAGALGLVLLAAYATTLGLPGALGPPTRERVGDEAAVLAIAERLAGDGVLSGAEGHALGLPLLAAGLLALDGALLVELALALTAAAAFVVAAALARRVAPDPWATGAALAVGLSPAVVASAGTVSAELAAGGLVAGAAVLALRVRDRPALAPAAGAAALLALVPWLTLAALPAAGVVGAAVVRWLLRRGRGLQALVAAEVLVFSAVTYVTVNDRLFGGLTPQAGTPSPTGASGLGEHLARADRVVGVWLDREAGGLRWSPVLALALFALWLLWRSRRSRLAVVAPGQQDVEVAAALCALVLAAQVGVAAFLAPALAGPWPPARWLLPALPAAVALCAWGLRHAPRAGTALAALGAAGSAWLVVQARLGDAGLAPPTTAAPLGPLEALLPRWEPRSGAALAVTAAVVAALALLALRERRRGREVAAGARRRAVLR